MSLNAKLIQGGQHTDHRGTITFFNGFDMKDVKRFYIIQNNDISTVRAWRAHKIEERWLCVSDGEFLIRLVEIDNWESPNKYMPIKEFELSTMSNQILYIPRGYASWIQAKQDDSKLIVFADQGIENAKFDDYLFAADYFKEKK